MGNWQLEVAKMALYVSFPVALFHYFNQPEFYEDWVKDVQQSINPPDDTEFREKLKEVIKKQQEREEAKMLEALNEKQK